MLQVQSRAQQTTGTIPKFDATPPALVNSIITESAGKIGINNASPAYTLDITGNLRTTQDASINGIRVGRGLGNEQYSTALGFSALNSTTTGGKNTMIGHSAGINITSTQLNTGVGFATMMAGAGNGNTALGSYALQYWQSGNYNIGVGYDAMHGISSTSGGTGAGNIAIGRLSMGASNPSGSYNVAMGYVSLPFVTTGANNIALGYNAGYTLTTGSSNILIGTSANASSATASNELNIGNWIYGNGGNIGIGVSAPATKFDVNGTVKATGLLIPTGAGSGKVLTSDGSGNATWQTNTGSGEWTSSAVGTNNITNTNTGGVIIGSAITAAPSGYKLYVQSGILTERVKVKLISSGWPDYVFAKDYNLLSLQETEDFIKKNSHLPGVISAEEVKKEGVDLGESNAVLLKKIEELTLYMIAADKEIKNLQQNPNCNLQASFGLGWHRLQQFWLSDFCLEVP